MLIAFASALVTPGHARPLLRGYFTGGQWKQLPPEQQSLYVAGVVDGLTEAEFASKQQGFFTQCLAAGGNLQDRTFGEIRTIVAGYVAEAGSLTTAEPMALFVAGALHRACQ